MVKKIITAFKYKVIELVTKKIFHAIALTANFSI